MALLSTLKSQMLLFLMMIILLGLTTSIPVPEPEPEPEPTVHELLQEYGLPPGLFPDSVKSYNLSDHGHLKVELYDDCSVPYGGVLLYYDQEITANLQYGSLTDIHGIHEGTVPIAPLIYPPVQRDVLKIWVDSPTSIFLFFTIFDGYSAEFTVVFDVTNFFTVPSCVQPYLKHAALAKNAV